MIRPLRSILLGLLLVVSAAAVPDPDPIAQIRADYLAAVDDPRAIARGLARVEALRASPAGARNALEQTAAAYHGALITLRARHATWPPAKLRHLRHGLAILDGVVARDPEHLEARYLRLMSCYSLPTVLGRRASVTEDFGALARLLPTARGAYPADKLRDIAAFVLQNGSVSPLDRARLQPLTRSGD